VAGALFLRQTLGGENVTVTPTMTLTPPAPTASVTMPPATATPPPTEGAATATLMPPSFELLEPREGETFAPGTQVTFHWDVPEILRDSLSLVVMVSPVGHDELCRSDHLSCTYTFDEEGTHEWWAELVRGDQVIATTKENPRTLHIRTTTSTPRPKHTPALTPTFTPISLPTATPTSESG
jgi:hypothetical protein